MNKNHNVFTSVINIKLYKVQNLMKTFNSIRTTVNKTFKKVELVFVNYSTQGFNKDAINGLDFLAQKRVINF